ncbi:MAG: VOC family protein [Verrucomicrobiae bacterium]|nr:VOC family protein [Verrucomicrobiae bacterium]
MLAPGYESKVMHTSFRIGQTVVMASDGCGTEQTSFQDFSLSLTVPIEAEAARYFNALQTPGPLKCSTAVPSKEIGFMLKSGWLATTP